MADSSELPLCPHCGRPFASENDPFSSAGDDALVFASEATQTMETMIPQTHCGDDGPHRDEHAGGLLLSHPTNGNGHHWAPNAPSHSMLLDSDEFSTVPPADSSGFDPLVSPVADPILDAIAEPRPNSTEADGSEERATSWPLVVLGSYASAMTLAVAWLLWHGYGREPAGRDSLPVPSRGNAGRALLSPLPAERRATLGQTIRVGSLEITPLSLASEPVRLEWSRPGEDRGEEVGPECLTLRLRLKNVSTDETFAALNRVLVRPSDSGEMETFLEVDGAVIGSFPLAVSSEKTIAGQSFADLKPGESAETIVVSEPGASGRFVAPGTWRLRLRVTPDQSATIGVDIRPEDLK